MTEQQLIFRVSSRLQITQVLAEQVLEEFVAAIKEQMLSGDDVKLKGFGTFHVKKHQARPGRNPRTGKELQVPARRRPKWRPSPFFVDAFNR